MSDQSQGPGWWLASDGKWYAPDGPTGVEPLPAPAPGSGRSHLPQVIAGVAIAVALLGGGAAFALTRDSGGGNSVEAFCAKAKTLHNDIDLDQAFTDPTKVDEVVAKFHQLVKVAPAEIQADMNTLEDGVSKARDAVKSGQNPSAAFTTEASAKIETASHNIENFGEQKCGNDFLLSSSSDDGSSTSIATSPSSSSTSSGSATDAAATRDKMLDLAKEPGAVDASSQPPVDAWTRELPNLDFIGSALPAAPDIVSGFTVVSSKAKDVDYFAFAVSDSDGHCAAGVLEFDSSGTKVTKSVKVNGPSQCTADKVAESLGY